MGKNQAQERRNRIEKGLCRFCVRPRLLNSNQLCEDHYIGNAIKCAIGKCDKETVAILKARFYDRPYCPYTGEKLIFGVNTHIDHVESKKNRPDLAKELNNLEWVSDRANLAKNGMSKQEFIQFCSLVASLNKSP